jgi:hypothetical protein
MPNVPVLNPRDVAQVAFLLEQKADTGESPAQDDGKKSLGQLTIVWRGPLGDRGSLSTGWLTSRR